MDLDRTLIDVACPRCGYAIEIQLLDATVQAYRWCPCCRVQLHLVEDGSASNAVTDVESSLTAFLRSLKGFAT
jgi:hypothetical protein